MVTLMLERSVVLRFCRRAKRDVEGVAWEGRRWGTPSVVSEFS
jgi:hypothetical protein